MTRLRNLFNRFKQYPTDMIPWVVSVGLIVLTGYWYLVQVPLVFRITEFQWGFWGDGRTSHKTYTVRVFPGQGIDLPKNPCGRSGGALFRLSATKQDTAIIHFSDCLTHRGWPVSRAPDTVARVSYKYVPLQTRSHDGGSTFFIRLDTCESQSFISTPLGDASFIEVSDKECCDTLTLDSNGNPVWDDPLVAPAPTHEDDRRAWERSKPVRDGNRTGPFTEYYSAGELKAKGSYQDGWLHGKYTRWRQTGEKWFEQEYVRGLKHGIHRSWHKNGLLNIEERWDNGKLHGYSRAYYRDGSACWELEFENGKVKQ